MRSSRVSKDKAKLFERVPGSALPSRRTTRSSLARFAYSTTTTIKTENQTADIEDAIGAPTKKRRRLSSSSPVVKSEIIEEGLALNGVSSPPAKAPLRTRRRLDSANPAVKCNEDDISFKSEPCEDGMILIASPITKPPRRTRKPVRKVIGPSGETTMVAPSDWEEMYNLVRQMRAPGGAAHGAAVDTMGCERLADRNASPKDQRFHTLVSLMMSSQTKDTVNAVVMRKLQTELPPYKSGAPVGLNLENILAVDPTMLNEMIWAVGFHNNKTKYIKRTAEILRDEWNGDIPDTIEGLTSLPGVGPKMAYLCMSVAWDRTEGIGVDVHVHRITNLWGWNTTKNPEETRHVLQSWLPKDKWREINHLLVGLGQKVCLPVGRKCGDCELGLQGLCKAAERKKVLEGRRIKEEMVKVKQDGTMVKKEEVMQEVAVKEEVINQEPAIKEEDVTQGI